MRKAFNSRVWLVSLSAAYAGLATPSATVAASAHHLYNDCPREKRRQGFTGWPAFAWNVSGASDALRQALPTAAAALLQPALRLRPFLPSAAHRARHMQLASWSFTMPTACMNA